MFKLFIKNAKPVHTRVSSAYSIISFKYLNVPQEDSQYVKQINITGRSFIANEPTTIFKGNNSSETEVNKPLEHILGALCGSEYSTALFISRSEMKININKVVYKNVEGIIDTRPYFGKSDSKGNKFSKIKMEVEFETEASQEELDELKLSVGKRCPIHNMLHLAGVEIEGIWKKKV